MSSPSASGTDDEIQFMGMRAAPAVTSSAPKPSAITLTVEAGDAAEPRTFSKTTSKTINIGRVTAEHAQRFASHPSQLVFVCPVMSRQHARINFAESGQVFLTDLNSHHGTVIARGDPAPAYIHLLPGNKYALYEGDLITFGKTVYKNSLPHEPVSVRISFTTTATPTASASPGPVRYGLIDSGSDDDSSESEDSCHESDASPSPPVNANPFTAPCMLPAPVLPSIASSFPHLPSLLRTQEQIVSVWQTNADLDQPQMLPPVLESQGSSGSASVSGSAASFPSQQGQVIDTPRPDDVDLLGLSAVDAAAVRLELKQDVEALKDQINHVLYALKVQASHTQAAGVDVFSVRQQLKQEVEVLKEHVDLTVRALKQDTAATGASEWDLLRASVRAEFPDGLRDRVDELEAGVRSLADVATTSEQISTLRAELQSSKDEVAALKSAFSALEDTLKTLNSDTNISPRKRKRTDLDDDEPTRRPSVSKRLRQSAPLVAAGAMAMYLGLCAI